MAQSKLPIYLVLAFLLTLAPLCSTAETAPPTTYKMQKIVPGKQPANIKGDAPICNGPSDSLAMYMDQTLVWHKTIDELLQSKNAKVYNFKRNKNRDKRMLPLTSLVPANVNQIKHIILTNCEGKDIHLSIDKFIDSKKPLLVSKNNKGLIKISILKHRGHDDQDNRFPTWAKGITKITFLTR